MTARATDIVKATLVAILASTLSACGAYYDAPGMGDNDCWLEQRSVLSPDRWDKVVLVFGYGKDSYQVCTDFAEAKQ